MSDVFLGLGSNLGDRRGNIVQALNRLKQCGISVERVSTIIETAPQGGPPQSPYLNAVIKGQTDLRPELLLKTVKDIERELGRTPSVRNGPRIIDIDILLYDDIKINTDDLTIPHPRMKERSFVMIPLSEIMDTT